MSSVFIYALRDPRTDKIRYIGKTNNVKRRVKAHFHSLNKENTHRANWLKSLVFNNMSPIVVVLDEVPEANWEFFERAYIKLYRELGANLTNGTDGGEGVTMTPEVRAKIGLKNQGRRTWLGKKHSKKTRKKMSRSATGKSPSEETRKKIGVTSRERIHSAETRAKMSVAHRGKTYSEEVCANISRANTPEVTAKRTATRRMNAALAGRTW